MALANESNTSLAYDTTIFKEYGARYENVATELRQMAKKLNNCLTLLADAGWTTPAGKTFQKLAETNWEKNIDKYADLLDTLKKILDSAAKSYDDLSSNHIDKTKLK